MFPSSLNPPATNKYHSSPTRCSHRPHKGRTTRRFFSKACERASEIGLGEPLLTPPHSGSASSCTRPTMARRIALLSIRLNALMSLSPSWLETKSLMYCIGNAEVTCLSAAPSKKNDKTLRPLHCWVPGHDAGKLKLS